MPIPFAARRAAVALCIFGCSLSALASDESIRVSVTKELASPTLAHATVGVCIRSLSDGRTILTKEADRLLMPASNMKLLVSSCCTDALPADFHYTTPALRDGTLDGGTLTGNLYLKGDGDPTLEYADLQQLARDVKAAGITHVTGDVVGDGSALDSRKLGSGWEWDDLSAYYAAEVDGLTVDRGSVTVRTLPGEVGQPPAVSVDPDAGYVLIRNEATTVQDSAPETLEVSRELGENIIVASGQIRRGNKTAVEYVSVHNPSAYTAFLFRKCLQDAGITIDGSPRSGVTPAGATKVAAHDSAGLPDILKLLNKPSDNLIAETLLKTLGRVKKGNGSAAAGADVERAYLEKIGVDAASVNIVDGSGLARQDNVTADALTRVLSYMWSHPNRSAFVDSLPVAGVDGTIRNRMKGGFTTGNVQAKTGSLTRVSSLSGYVRTRDGEPLVFSIVMNNFTGGGSEAHAIQDRICAAMAASTK
ncbi:MAG TPA: D-alanyl-D-alanine carboxypeptidase/D-alanyl-D-alanine-endopeptidase [Armatimonadota bacterium]|jgi:D-alanyl-D-alanine carboxypeptidase/D-alanyl-D-alanine-endopeptidase (penicillin-binding protein 4)